MIGTRFIDVVATRVAGSCCLLGRARAWRCMPWRAVARDIVWLAAFVWHKAWDILVLIACFVVRCHHVCIHPAGVSRKLGEGFQQLFAHELATRPLCPAN